MSKLDEMMKDCAEFERGCLVQGHKADSVKRDESKFAHLEHKLPHRKGVTNPRALTAWIGQRKLGKKEMAKRSAASRKAHER